MPFGDPSRLARLRDTIAKRWPARSCRTRCSPSAAPSGARAFQVTPRVNFDNEASQTATVVEVEGLDRPGFLYDVARALFESGLSISSSMIATYGEKAVDVFYVRDGFGHKVVHPDRLAAVEARLIAAIEGEQAEVVTVECRPAAAAGINRGLSEGQTMPSPSTTSSSFPACSRPTRCIWATIWAR